MQEMEFEEFLTDIKTYYEVLASQLKPSTNKVEQ